MKIQVWKRYAENRASEPIEEGIYEQSDRKLFGLARYLIDNGNARVVVEAPVAEEPQTAFEKLAEPHKASKEVADFVSTGEHTLNPKEEVVEKPKRTRKAKS